MCTKCGLVKYPYFSRLASIGFILFCLIFGIGTPTEISYAGGGSYLNFRNKNEVSHTQTYTTEPQNSQKISFLEATAAIDPIHARGGGDITTIDDTALVAEIGPSGTINNIEARTNQGKISLYVVRRGDTLSGVAKIFNVNLHTILWANDLPRNATISYGQTLIILPVDGVQHVIKKGDTLKSITKKYQGDVDEVILLNNLSDMNSLIPGDIIVIPNGTEPADPQSTIVKNSRRQTIARYPSYKGYYSHPFPTMRLKTQGIHGYNGVDLGGPVGEPVLAAAEGTIIVSNYRGGNPWFGGYGNYIVIEHANGTQTLYAHLSDVFITIGTRVEKEQVIGSVGNTGRSTGPHLHFEVRGARNPF